MKLVTVRHESGAVLIEDIKRPDLQYPAGNGFTITLSPASARELGHELIDKATMAMSPTTSDKAVQRG